MIKEIDKNNVAECVEVIRKSFLTIAEQFGFTIENAPRFTAFATTEERLLYQLENEPRFFENGMKTKALFIQEPKNSISSRSHAATW